MQYKTPLELDILDPHLEETARHLATNYLREMWSDSAYYDLNPEEYIPIIVDYWIKNYVLLDLTKEAIEKIKRSEPPEGLSIYLETERKDLYIEGPKTPIFRAYLYTRDLWDTYLYICENDICKFESLEIIEPADILEIKKGLSEEGQKDLDDVVIKSYEFHNRLLRVTPKKLRLYTAQPEERIQEWNRTGIIPKGSYFTDRIERAEYYYNPEENDIIVYYKIPEDKVVITSEFANSKEYVTIDDIRIE